MAALADPAEVRAHLVAAAQAGVALSYGELLEQLGYRFSRPKMRQLCAILGAVDEDGGGARRAGAGGARRPPERRHSGPGLVGGGGAARSRGYAGPWEGPEAARFIRALQAETFAFLAVQKWDRAAGNRLKSVGR